MHTHKKNLTQRKNPRLWERSSLKTERSEHFHLVVTKISLVPPRPKDTKARERVWNLSREAWSAFNRELIIRGILNFNSPQERIWAVVGVVRDILDALLDPDSLLVQLVFPHGQVVKLSLQINQFIGYLSGVTAWAHTPESTDTSIYRCGDSDKGQQAHTGTHKSDFVLGFSTCTSRCLFV